MYPLIGYYCTTPTEISNVVHLIREGRIRLSAARCYFACFELLARRDAAARVRAKQGVSSVKPVRFLLGEIAFLTGLSTKSVKRELRCLAKEGVLNFSEKAIVTRKELCFGADLVVCLASGKRSANRQIPVPRVLLKVLARSKTKSSFFVLLAYILRGISFGANKEVVGKGCAKIRWIMTLSGLSERSVQYARATLIAENIISDDENSYQRKLNRDGAYFSFNFEALCRTQRLCPVKPIAPPQAKSSGSFAPPIEKQETPYGSKNQKPAERTKPGVCTANSQGGIVSPNLKDIHQTDLRSLKRLRELYAQAVAARWLTASDASFRDFVSAAVRALRAKDGDPVRIFVGLVKKGLWHHISGVDEARALEVIARDQRKARGGEKGIPRTEAAGVSELIHSLAEKLAA